MRRRKNWLIVLLLTLTLLLAACGGGDGDSESGNESGFGDGVAQEGPTPRSLADVASINSFKVRMSANTAGPAFQQAGEAHLTSFDMEGAFTKDPAAHHFAVQTAGGEAASQIEVIQLGETIYTRLDDQWIRTQAEGAPTAQEFLLVAPEKVAGIDKLEEVGKEDVNGRSTTHLRGGSDFVSRLNAGNELNLQGLEKAQLDMWLDEEEEFVVRMSLVAEGVGLVKAVPDAKGRLEFAVEYFDFNEKLTIQPPEGVATGGLLGMKIDLPQGSKVDYASSDFAQVTMALGPDEARNFVEGALGANGYTLNTNESAPEMGTYTFNSAEQKVTVIITEDGGQTSLIISAE